MGDDLGKSNDNIFVEIVEFKLFEGTEEDEFLKASEVVTKDFLEKQPGYIKRELLKSERDEWMDIVHWESFEDAQNASAEFLENDDCLKFAQLIDEEQMKIMHLEQVMVY